VNLLRDNINIIKKGAKTLGDGSREVCLEVNVENTTNTLLSRHQVAGKNRNIEEPHCVTSQKTAFFKSKYHWEEIKKRLNTGYAFYHSV
jgi:hypothetical protein